MKTWQAASYNTNIRHPADESHVWEKHKSIQWGYEQPWKKQNVEPECFNTETRQKCEDPDTKLYKYNASQAQESI